jgi:hypothetical protein
MAYEPSERRPDDPSAPRVAKIMVAGGLGAGKTTMVGAVSESRALHTEEDLSDRGAGVDDLAGVEGKATTTVAMDFGRITISEDVVLYLFGTPGQSRFSFLWDELALGALGAVVLADTRRLADCFPCVDYLEERGMPFIVAVNCFEGARTYRLEEVRRALNLEPAVPVMPCDARERESGKQVLIALLRHLRPGVRRI